MHFLRASKDWDKGFFVREKLLWEFQRHSKSTLVFSILGGLLFLLFCISKCLLDSSWVALASGGSESFPSALHLELFDGPWHADWCLVELS